MNIQAPHLSKFKFTTHTLFTLLQNGILKPTNKITVNNMDIYYILKYMELINKKANL